jgi:uncharacterized protein (TIGR03083 family)
MADGWSLLADERRTLADLVATLDEGQLATPSLCTGWTVRDVVAHLTLSLAYKPSTVARAMLRARGSFPRAVVLMTADAAEQSTDDLVALLRDRADLQWAPPGFGVVAPLTDVLVHGVDLRRPIGLPYAPPAEAVRIGLDFIVRPKAGRGFTQTRSRRGLRFEATDLDWASGTGPVVRGPALPLLAALCNRPAVLDDLAGDGVAVLRERLTA